MAQIFLSYSRNDSDAANALAVALNESGHSVWWDKNISGGAKFAAEIEQALAAAEIVIVLWSRNSITSAWVLDEAAEGRDTGRLLPVALDDSKPPLGFRQFQTIAAYGGLEAAAKQVLDAIQGRLNAGPELGNAQQASIATGPETHFAKARHLAERGEFDMAWREIEVALRLDEDSAEANRQAARLLYVQGRTPEAIPYYERASACSKGDHESPAMLISCYRAIGDEDALKRVAALAVSRAEQAIAAAPSSGPTFASGAKGLAALGHRERARKWVRKGLNVEPGNLAMRYCMASTLANFLDDADGAIDVLEPFIELTSKQIDLQLLECDPDWASVRGTAAFQKLLNQVRKRVDAVAATTGASGQGS